ncbi:hypothetical protein [Bosea sp. MMO-172]|uniref:hypothetical protein n=1 Tax=Bosea sp. MMO-172 TaxID=3127885 RepID=UPI00301A0691
MWNESGPQHAGRADPNDIIAEIDAIEVPAEQPDAAPESQPAELDEPESIAAASHAAGRFKAAIDAAMARHRSYLANPDTYEAAKARGTKDANNEASRIAYAASAGRPIRDYERGQTPERRAEKKAAKSKGERVRREARSTPEQIEADKQAARDRAKASYERRKKKAEAQPEPAQPEGFGKF